MKKAWVVGIESDIAGIAGSRFGNNTDVAPIPAYAPYAISTTTNFSKSVDYIGTVRGREGYLFTPGVVAYATGGLAYGIVSSSSSFTQLRSGPAGCTICAPYSSLGSLSDTRVGWTAGVGTEWMFMRNWSAKIEYLYYDLGGITYAGSSLVNSLTAVSAGVPAGTAVYTLVPSAQTWFNGNIIRAGLNYHFN